MGETEEKKKERVALRPEALYTDTCVYNVFASPFTAASQKTHSPLAKDPRSPGPIKITEFHPIYYAFYPSFVYDFMGSEKGDHPTCCQRHYRHMYVYIMSLVTGLSQLFLSHSYITSITINNMYHQITTF